MRRVLFACLFVACVEPQPSGPTGPTGPTNGMTGTTGMTGETGMIVLPTTVTKIIGTAGGELALNTTAALNIPPNALATETSISIREADETIAGYEMFSKVYYFEPEGTTFSAPFIAEIEFGGDVAKAKLYWSKVGNVNDFDETPGLALGTKYTAAVTHFSRAFVGAKIPVVVVLTPPLAPTALTAKAGDTDVDLTWQPSAGATLYKVYGSQVSGGPYSLINTVSSPGFVHSELVNGTTYYYVVKANNADGDSPQSNEATAQPQDLEAPTVTNITPADTVITLAWSAPLHATSSTTYQVYRDGMPVVGGIVSGLSFPDTGRTNGVEHFYAVTARDPDANQSGLSNALSAFAFKYPTGFAPSAPTGPSGCTIDFSWTANGDGTHHYDVTYQIDGGDPEPGIFGPSGPTGTTGTTFRCTYRYDTNNGQSNGVTVQVKACYDATENFCGGETVFPLPTSHPFNASCAGATTCP